MGVPANAERIQQTYDQLRTSVCRVRELPDDDSWIPDRRRIIGDRVRAERKRQKLTQEQVMLAARIDRVTLWRLESGQETMLSTLLRVARVLDVTLSALDG